SADESRRESDRLTEWTNRQEPERLKDERDQPVVSADARAGVLWQVFLQQCVPPGVGQLPGAEPEQECACDEQNWRRADQGERSEGDEGQDRKTHAQGAAGADPQG